MTSGTTLFPGGVDNQTGADPFAFGYIPPLTHTALTQDVAVGDTTFHVVSTTGFETRGALAVGTSNGDTEHFTYTGLTATTFTGVTRAFGGTARVHVSGAMVAAIILPQTVNAHGAAIVALETRLRMLTSGPLANGSLVASVAASALTIAVKTASGADPSATDPVRLRFRSATAANGDESLIDLVAATSIVVSSGSTLGTANSTAFRLWLVAFNDGGTVRLGVINCRSGTTIYPLAGWAIASSTAEGGAGAADAAQTFYTGAAVTAMAYTVLGYATWESGLGTAGTWSAGPTRIALFGAHTPLPGQTIQDQGNTTGAVATGNTAMPHDDTIPQSGEGDEYMTQAITPTSAANLLEIETVAALATSITDFISAALFQDAVAGALVAGAVVGTAGFPTRPTLRHRMLAGTTVATTFKVRAGITAAGVGGGGVVTFNGVGAGRIFGGVNESHLNVSEKIG